MIQIKDFEFDSLCNLITIAYDRVMDDIDLMIVEKTQEYLDLGFSVEEAKKQVLSKYRGKAINDETTILKNLGKYRSAYNDYFDEDTESYLDGYSQKAARSLANGLLKSDNNITKHEFENEQQLIEYIADKIECFEIINRISIKRPTIKINDRIVSDYIVPVKHLSIFYEEYNDIIWESMSKDNFLNSFDRNSDTIEYPIFRSRMKNKFIRFLVVSEFDSKGEAVDDLIFRCFGIKNYKGAKHDLDRKSKNPDKTDSWIDNLFK